MRKAFLLLHIFMLCFMTMLALVSCGDDFCQHRDADDDLECDYCKEEYIDGKDVEILAVCSYVGIWL